jgi:hypothetical protein
VNYHIVWSPKYRYKVIVGDVEKWLRALLREKCSQLGIDILSLETMPDHIHIFVRASPIIAPNDIVAGLKGYTSRILRQEFPELRSRLPTLWIPYIDPNPVPFTTLRLSTPSPSSGPGGTPFIDNSISQQEAIQKAHHLQ